VAAVCPNEPRRLLLSVWHSRPSGQGLHVPKCSLCSGTDNHRVGVQVLKKKREEEEEGSNIEFDVPQE